MNAEQKIELEMAVERAGLNVVDVSTLSADSNGNVMVFLSGKYTVNEIQSLLADVVRVEQALARIQR